MTCPKLLYGLSFVNLRLKLDLLKVRGHLRVLRACLSTLHLLLTLLAIPFASVLLCIQGKFEFLFSKTHYIGTRVSRDLDLINL